MKNKHIIGIVGGVGPFATAAFYKMLITGFEKEGFEERPEILIYNLPYKLSEEKNEILRNKLHEAYADELISKAIDALEAGGADLFVMPCNSLHTRFVPLIKQKDLPYISIIEATAACLAKNQVNEITVISTELSKFNDVFNKNVDSDIKFINLTDSETLTMSWLIYRLNTDDPNHSDYQLINNLLASLHNRGVKNVLLGCTDLGALDVRYPQMKIFNTLSILAEATVKECSISSTRSGRVPTGKHSHVLVDAQQANLPLGKQ